MLRDIKGFTCVSAIATLLNDDGSLDTHKRSMDDVAGSEWSKYIVAIKDAADQLTCATHCSLLKELSCHYYVFDDTTGDCRLGNFEAQSSVMEPSELAVTVHIQYSEPCN